VTATDGSPTADEDRRTGRVGLDETLDDGRFDGDAEEMEDALVEGDRAVNPGTARAALAYQGFRRVFGGFALSNVGSWMQNVVLNAYALALTGSPTFVALMNFATLGPLLLLSLVGGSLADRFDRKRIIIAVSVEQAAFAFVLAALVRDPDPSRLALVAAVFAMGCGQAIVSPTFSAVLPGLVRRPDLPGAVSLVSANMNLSRVLGAPLGALVYSRWGVSWVFAVNAVTYFFIIAGVVTVKIPRVASGHRSTPGLRGLADGFRVIGRDPVKKRIIITCASFSLFSLLFITWMPVLAARNLGMDPKSTAYGILFACFGLGAAGGALSLGTVLAGRDLARIARVGFAGFAAALTAFALWRNALPAYPTAFVVGFTYFMAMTSLSTVLQSRLADRDRGKVMAIWIMSFGGVVSVGPLLMAPVLQATSITAMLLFGAAWALALSFYVRLRDLPDDGSPAALEADAA
jgi:predicted MFS family arabinose efflux permease